MKKIFDSFSFKEESLNHLRDADFGSAASKLEKFYQEKPNNQDLKTRNFYLTQVNSFDLSGDQFVVGSQSSIWDCSGKIEKITDAKGN